MLKKIESRVGKVGLAIGAFLLATLLFCIPIGIFGSSNIIWGDGDQYGRVDVPGKATLHLPSRTVEVEAALDIVGKGNQTVDVPLPDNLGLTVTPAGGGDPLTVTRDTGTSGNTLDDSTNSQIKVFDVDVPSDGDYDIKTKGNFTGIGINPQFFFGHGPPIPGTLVPVIGAVLALIAMAFYYLVLPRFRGTEEEKRGWEDPSA